MIQELIRAFFFIFIAEMGDKTQILAMAFATQYSVSKVLGGVFLGSFLNHGLAIALGAYLSTLIPLDTVGIIAGISFIGFGLWGLKYDDDEDEDEGKEAFSPVLTVALAFFIGELGDKTQLTALTLSTDAKYPIFILGGTVLGMIGTSAMGIYIGRKIGEKIPEFTIKVVSSGIFITFGLIKLYNTISPKFVNAYSVLTLLILLSLSIYLLLKPTLRARKAGISTPLKEVATTLYLQAQEIKEAVNDLCLGEGKCGGCDGTKCLVGFAKKSLSLVEEGDYYLSPKWDNLPTLDNSKSFDRIDVIKAMALTIDHYINFNSVKDDNYVVNKTRMTLEKILFKETIPFNGDMKSYFKEISKRDKKALKNLKVKLKEIENRRNKKA